MLPGRTEDAVKIRWKSLCRVRKGQVRRGSHGEKSKTPTNSNSDSGVHSPMSSSNPAAAMDMNSGVQMQNDVGYGSMQQQQAAAMGMGIVNNRLQVPMSHGIPTNPMTMMNPMQTQMGYYPQAHMNTFNPMGQTNMYTNMMQMAGTIAGDPTGSGIPGQEFNIDRRANAVNLSTNGGGLTPTSYAAAVSNPYNTGNGQFGTGSSAHIFANQVGIYGQTMPQMMMNSQQMQYMNPAANFAFAQHQQATPAAVSTLAATSSVNPVANFIQQQQQRQVQVQQTSPSPSTQQQQNKQAAFNPVAAFIEQQKRQKQESGATKLAAPFNPAAAFAQQAAKSSGKPPMIGTGFTTSNSSTLGGGTAGSSANRDTSTEDDGQEPSWKKVKPRTSIDAARASAARRLRNSVSATASTGRPSLDVFLNEIGDIGRISDLKMDEFQTLDEMWRVSDDMSRLSL
jgi:hypothetical protein